MTAASPILKAPFPYFGGKSRVAKLVWERFGDVRNYVEPFFGSGAVLLLRPRPFRGPETVNDADGLLANFWRALQADAEAVAHHADWPVNENDLHSRHAWLVERKDSLQARLEGDPDWFDAKAAGWWVWGLSSWIGSGWCSGKGPWRAVADDDGVKVLAKVGNNGLGVNRQRPHLGDNGLGVNRQRPHLGNAGQAKSWDGGVVASEFSPRKWDRTAAETTADLLADFAALADRLRSVRVCCGDWSRAISPAVTTTHRGFTAVFLDPPYLHAAGRAADLYRRESATVADSVRDWAVANGDNPKLRIALCGYVGEHEMPDSWRQVAWRGKGGFGNQSGGRGRDNAGRERIWFSPHCLKPAESVPSGEAA